MANFPSHKPTSRSFRLGQYPIQTYRAMSGAVVRRSFGNRAYGYTLELEFANVLEDVVSAIIIHYDGQGGGTIGFALPADVFSGYTATVTGKIQAPAGIEWVYAGPPDVSSVFKDISTVRVSLIGELK